MSTPITNESLNTEYLGNPDMLKPKSSQNIELDDEEDDDDDMDGTLHLCTENVEKVLDELRPYLISDGGNVRLVEIDGPIVKLELEGACSSCPSSTVTMSMGIIRALKEKIPEIEDIEEVTAEGEKIEISREGVEEVFAEVRPFLEMTKGSLTLEDFQIGYQP